MEAVGKLNWLSNRCQSVDASSISESLNLPQLLADSARCKELRERVRQLENSAKFEDGIQKDLKEALVESDKINDTLRARITELEAEVARLKGELNRFSLTRKIGHSTPQEQP